MGRVLGRGIRQDVRVDDHAARVLASLERAIAGYRSRTSSVQDLQWAVATAAGALDNRYADLVEVLRRVDSDLEMASYAMPAEDGRPFVLSRCDEMTDAIARA
jgi:hypothetical protein